MARSTDLRRAILDQASRGDAGPAPEPETLAGRPGAPPPRSAASSADRDATLQALPGEAVNDLFAKHGLPELIERD